MLTVVSRPSLGQYLTLPLHCQEGAKARTCLFLLCFETRHPGQPLSRSLQDAWHRCRPRASGRGASRAQPPPSLQSEVNAVVSGFAGREQGASLLRKTYTAMKRTRMSYRRVKLDHDSDNDSDAGGVGPKSRVTLRFNSLSCSFEF